MRSGGKTALATEIARGIGPKIARAYAADCARGVLADADADVAHADAVAAQAMVARGKGGKTINMVSQSGPLERPPHRD